MKLNQPFTYRGYEYRLVRVTNHWQPLYRITKKGERYGIAETKLEARQKIDKLCEFAEHLRVGPIVESTFKPGEHVL